MCGIVGCVTSNDINAMLKKISHRGPDGEGVHIGDAFHFGVRCLKITDPDSATQPFYNETKSICIILNGEIYNYNEIKQKLSGHTFTTQTDTEVIVHAYEEYGIDCVKEFNGCFAFAILDGEKIILVRDRLGQKPLYYHFKNNRFIFGSEIKSVLSQMDTVVPDLSESFFAFETPTGQSTVFKDVYQVPPASVLTYADSKVSINQYWQLAECNRHDSEKDFIEELRWLIQDSVRLRMRGAGEIGLFLSGGLDSSLLAYLAKPQYVFSCCYGDNRFDESHFMTQVARGINAEHIIIQPSAETFTSVLPKLIWHLDQPLATASPFSAYMLAEAAQKHVRIVLTGEGADELFGGYVRYLFMLYGDSVLQHNAYKTYTAMSQIINGLKDIPDFIERYFAFIQRGKVNSSIPKEYVKSIGAKFTNPLNAMLACDIAISLPSLLMMIDRVTAAFGMENRCPYLDYRIVDLAFSLPPELKIKEMQTKYILREAARGIVPDEIIDRREKMGLVTPIGQWFSHELKDWKKALLADFERRNIPFTSRHERGEFDRTEYMKICTEIWFKTFIACP